jgi:hypothetical protein
MWSRREIELPELNVREPVSRDLPLGRDVTDDLGVLVGIVWSSAAAPRISVPNVSSWCGSRLGARRRSQPAVAARGVRRAQPRSQRKRGDQRGGRGRRILSI